MSELLLLEWVVLLEEMHMGMGNSIFKNPLVASSQSIAWVDTWLWYSPALPQLLLRVCTCSSLSSPITPPSSD